MFLRAPDYSAVTKIPCDDYTEFTLNANEQADPYSTRENRVFPPVCGQEKWPAPRINFQQALFRWNSSAGD